jgi:hypothetical protein
MALLAGEERGQVALVQPIEGVEKTTAETLWQFTGFLFSLLLPKLQIAQKICHIYQKNTWLRI